MFTERKSVGLDVHARSVPAAAIDGVSGELFQTKLPPGNDRIVAWVGGVPGPVPVNAIPDYVGTCVKSTT